MALNIKDPELLSQIEHLARVRRVKKMDVIRDALSGAWKRRIARRAFENCLPLFWKRQHGLAPAAL
jgi:hypothetical protein